MRLAWSAVLVVLLCVTACGDDGGAVVDANSGSADAPPNAIDSGPADAREIDAGAGCLQLTAHDPAGDAVDVPVTQTVLLAFNHTIDVATATAITASSAAGEASVIRTASTTDPRLVSLTFEPAMEFDTVYTITAGATLAANNGCRLAQAESFSFTTASAP